MSTAKGAVKRVLPARLRRRLRRVQHHLRAENRQFTLRAPVARAVLESEALALRRERGRRPVGVARLSSISVINLPDRPDRLAAFTGEAARLGLDNVHRVNGIRDENGLLGCTRAHASCVEEMLDRSWPAMMVCEDDAAFRVGRPQLDVLVDRFLDDDAAEVACLAFLHRRVQPYDKLFLRALETQTMACYVVKSSIASVLLTVLREGVEGLAGGGSPSVFACDQVWKRLQSDRIFLVPIKRAAYQRGGYSDTERRRVDDRI